MTPALFRLILGEELTLESLLHHLPTFIKLAKADDGKFTLLALECLGSCDTAPVALFNEKLHENLTIASVDKLIDEAQKGTGGHH